MAIRSWPGIWKELKSLSGFKGLASPRLLLKYRVPTRTNETKWLAPVQDIQRSVSLVRSGAVEGVAPKRVGVLGFSAGGNASARVATADKRHYEAIDNIDDASAMPDFAVLVYPAWLVTDEEPLKLIDDLHVNEKSPPMFFAHAADDRINCMSSVTLFNELKQNGVPSSLHIFASGGHGFGGRTAGKPTDAWRDLCATWMSEPRLVEKVTLADTNTNENIAGETCAESTDGVDDVERPWRAAVAAGPGMGQRADARDRDDRRRCDRQLTW